MVEVNEMNWASGAAGTRWVERTDGFARLVLSLFKFTGNIWI